MSAARRRQIKVRRRYQIAQKRLRRKVQQRLDLNVIPRGHYCYSGSAGPDGNFKPCPFWSSLPNRPQMESGYCSLLELDDRQLGTGLLWDQVKECGIRQ